MQNLLATFHSLPLIHWAFEALTPTILTTHYGSLVSTDLKFALHAWRPYHVEDIEGGAIVAS